MNDQNASHPPGFIQSQSYRRHRRQRVVQILLPIIAAIMLILVIAALVIQTAVTEPSGGDVSQWADLSLIWLIMPVLGIAFFITVTLAGLIFVVARLLKILPGYTFQAQYYVGFASNMVATWMDKLVSPFIFVSSTKAGLKTLLSGLFSRSTK